MQSEEQVDNLKSLTVCSKVEKEISEKLHECWRVINSLSAISIELLPNQIFSYEIVHISLEKNQRAY